MSVNGERGHLTLIISKEVVPPPLVTIKYLTENGERVVPDQGDDGGNGGNGGGDDIGNGDNPPGAPPPGPPPGQ